MTADNSVRGDIVGGHFLEAERFRACASRTAATGWSDKIFVCSSDFVRIAATFYEAKMTTLLRTGISIAILVLVSTPLSAQWIKVPIAAVPRGSDGKPNLTAPAPRLPDGHPDLSGI